MNRNRVFNAVRGLGLSVAVAMACAACVGEPSNIPLEVGDSQVYRLGEFGVRLEANSGALFRGAVSGRDASPEAVYSALVDARQVAGGEANFTGEGHVQVFDVTGFDGARCKMSDRRPVCDVPPSIGRDERLFVVTTLSPIEERRRGPADEKGLLPEVPLSEMPMLYPGQGRLVTVPGQAFTRFGLDGVLPELPGRLHPDVDGFGVWFFGWGNLCHPTGHPQGQCETVPPPQLGRVHLWIDTTDFGRIHRRQADAGTDDDDDDDDDGDDGE